MLETDGHFREKLQAANAEDIKVRLQASVGGGRPREMLFPLAPPLTVTRPPEEPRLLPSYRGAH